MAKEKKTLRIDDILRYAGWLDAMQNANEGGQSDFCKEKAKRYEAAKFTIYEMVARLTDSCELDVIDRATELNPYLPYPEK